jgi:hypothetical protein
MAKLLMELSVCIVEIVRVSGKPFWWNIPIRGFYRK